MQHPEVQDAPHIQESKTTESISKGADNSMDSDSHPEGETGVGEKEALSH